MRAADEAAYKAKAAGKKTFCAVDIDTGTVHGAGVTQVPTDDVV